MRCYFLPFIKFLKLSMKFLCNAQRPTQASSNWYHGRSLLTNVRIKTAIGKIGCLRIIFECLQIICNEQKWFYCGSPLLVEFCGGRLMLDRSCWCLLTFHLSTPSPTVILSTPLTWTIHIYENTVLNKPFNIKNVFIVSGQPIAVSVCITWWMGTQCPCTIGKRLEHNLGASEVGETAYCNFTRYHNRTNQINEMFATQWWSETHGKSRKRTEKKCLGNEIWS